MTDETISKLYSAGRECIRVRERESIDVERPSHMSEVLACLDKATFACLDAAAQSGHAVAAFELSKLCSNAHSFVHDEQRAEALKQQAMTGMVKQVESNPDLAFDAGFAYFYESDPQDIQKAERCFQIGADAGNASCIWQLGEVAKREGRKERAFQRFLEAASLGQGMAMFAVAECYENGDGVSADREEAIRWYKRCAASNFAAHYDAEERLKVLSTP